MSEPTFIVRETAGGDGTAWYATNPETGITPGGCRTQREAEDDARALNAAYELGCNHESHRAGAVVQAATTLYYHPDSETALQDLLAAVKQYHNGDGE